MVGQGADMNFNVNERKRVLFEGASLQAAVIPGSAATTVEITRPNSKSVWTMLLRFGYVFCITILAPDPKGHVLQN